MNSILITGCSRGIGLEFVRQYASADWRVMACCRKPSEASELQRLEEQYKNLTVHALDVADFAQIEVLAKKLIDQKLDVLINNAGVYQFGRESFGNVDYDAWMASFRINCMAPLKMAESFLGQLMRGEQKKIINITSKMGSIDDNRSGQHYPYRSSKAALNMVTRSLARDLAPRGISAIALHPGLVQTDMGGYSAPTTVEQSIASMRKVIATLTLANSGRFYDFRGQEILW